MMSLPLRGFFRRESKPGNRPARGPFTLHRKDSGNDRGLSNVVLHNRVRHSPGNVCLSSLPAAKQTILSPLNNGLMTTWGSLCDRISRRPAIGNQKATSQRRKKYPRQLDGGYRFEIVIAGVSTRATGRPLSKLTLTRTSDAA
jgi:hypothetical protein